MELTALSLRLCRVVHAWLGAGLSSLVRGGAPAAQQSGRARRARKERASAWIDGDCDAGNSLEQVAQGESHG